MPDMLPVHSTTDWQAAFGFNAPGSHDAMLPSSGRVDDDLGFDPFQETQKALAEMMENEIQLQQQQHPGLASKSQHFQILSQQPRPPASVTVAKLLDGFTTNPIPNAARAQNLPPRSRLPPPGFSAPNHMNAFGLGIPRPPSNTGE